VTYRSSKTEAAAKVVPVLIALMVWAYATFMFTKGLGQLYKLSLGMAVLAGGLIALATWWLVRGPVSAAAQRQENSKQGVNALFIWPLICSAALLSFAHGANDVANAIGPLAAIYEAVKEGAVATKAATPLWIMVLGALGLAVGLALYGSRLIRTVGKEITELDNIRAYSIAMAATITVIVASHYGMPVSTTHITIGAVFAKDERKALKKAYKKELVKRSTVLRIVAALIITVPATALMASGLYFLVSAIVV
jgi:PiT family inorganic phosphate transporter